MDTRLVILNLALLLGLAAAIEPYNEDNYDHRLCYSSHKGKEYSGNIAVTAGGLTCQNWVDTNTNHWDFPEDTVAEASNYCRNPDNKDGGPWCNTGDPNTPWQYCEVKHCFGWVDSVEPRLIGYGSQVRITLRGKGFAQSQFNFGDDSHVGNRVWLVNEYESKECTVFVEATNEEMITCFSPTGLYDDKWSVRLSVDGVDTPESGICNGSPDGWHCSVRPYPWYSPHISGVVPRSGEADGIITIYGKFFTDAYGSNFGDASNGRTQKVLRAYVGGYNCELKDGDEFYGMALTHGDEGYIKCKIARINERGLSANFNVSVIIEAPFGATSHQASSLHVSATSSLFMYQSFAVIDSISPAVGSIVGGQLITITGDFFDESKAPAEVMVGNDTCTIESITDTQILCRTPAEQSGSPSSYPGNRGVRNDYFNDSMTHFDNLEDLSDSADQAATIWSDGGYWCEGPVQYKGYDCQFASAGDYTPNNYNVRSRGYFIPRQSGDYRFYVKSDDIVKLYLSSSEDEADKALIASSEAFSNYIYTHTEDQMSDRFTLEAGKAYYMEYISGEYGGYAGIYVGAAYYNTHLVQTVDGKVQPEVQSVQISSTEIKETLRLKLTDLTTRTATKEVQVVEMTYDDADGVWQLSMMGARTEILDVDTSAIDLENAINDLPSVHPERVTVTSSEVNNGRQYTITFNSELGDWPLFEEHTSAGCDVAVSADTDGAASLSSWRFHLADGDSNLVSDVMTTLTPTADDIAENLFTLFSSRCPISIGSRAPGKTFYEPYEDSNSPGFFGGALDYASEPFCGRGSGMNVARIFDKDSIDVSNGGSICFGYRGILKEYVRVEYSTNQRGTTHLYPAVDFPQDTDTAMDWKYICIDLKQGFEDWDAGHSGIKVWEVELYREPYNDIWVDEVVIAGAPTTENWDAVAEERRIPANSRVDEITVTYNDTEHYYDIEILPHNCANEFDMIQMYLAPVSSGNTGSGSSSVIYGDSGDLWPANARVEVERRESASPAVTGTWTLGDGQGEITFNADDSARNIMTKLALDLDLLDVKVTKSGTCYGYNYDLEWTQTSGDLPTMFVDGGDLTGNSAEISIEEVDGHVFYDPIPGDMIVTREDNPQVRVTINNINAKCRGDCSYEWNSANTPEFTGVDVTSGAFGDEIVIEGTGFSDTASENMVKVGTADCVITAASATEITCTLGSGDLGDFAIEVYTPEGLASDDTGTEFTYDAASVDSISPDTGSTAGGTLLELTGSGFDDSTVVTVGDVECTIVSHNSTSISCMTPEGADGTAEVAVAVGGTTATSSDDFTYAAGDTPEIDDFEPATSSPAGGETLVVSGSAFGGVYEDVTLSLISTTGEEIILVINETSADTDNLEAVLPSLPSGEYNVSVRVDNVGYAIRLDTPLTVSLRMDAISKTNGSMEGGTRLVIVGEGFGTDSAAASVMVGESECMIEEIHDTNITCYTGRGSKTHIISNQGTDPKFGLGYAWKPAVAVIAAGDIVRFQWTSPPFLSTNLFSVQQTFSSEANYNGTGFNSGNPSPSGSFEFQFNDVGTYYFTSGIIGANQDIELRGKINVTEKVPTAANVTVTVSGQDAKHNVGSGVSITETVDCAGTGSPIDGRSETDPSSGYEFEFLYSTLSTPTFESLDVVQGYIDTDITITGEGFSTEEDCDNEVRIGEYTCVPTSQSATEIVCNMDPAESPDVGVSLPVTVRVNNHGDPVVFSENTTFALLPSMTSVSPKNGSLNGGTIVNITGSGFVGDVEVTMGFASCNIIYQSYELITCETDANSESNNTVVVTVTNSYDAVLPVECDGDDCWFHFSPDATPTLTALESPIRIDSAETDLVISGTGLGDVVEDIRVEVGGVDCVVTGVKDDQVNCSLGPMSAGGFDIFVDVVGKGYGEGARIACVLDVDSVTPDSGSVYGGQVVTLAGIGFDMEETTVSLNGVDCAVSFVNETQVVCTTGASAAIDDSVVEVITARRDDNDGATYSYTDAATPSIASIDPVEGSEGDEVTIEGTGFSTDDAENVVMIGMAECTVTSSSATEIVCDLGASEPGAVAVTVNVAGYGLSDGDTEFTYTFDPSSASPDTGSFGGNLNVTVAGSGFVSTLQVSVCGRSAVVSEVDSSSVTFLTPDFSDFFSEGTKACDVNVTIGGETKIMTDAFTYEDSSTPQVDEISPTRGGTKGGTQITISGSNFGGNNENSVSVAGADCTILSESDTEIVCETNEPYAGSQRTNVRVQVDDVGVSTLDNTDFWYVDAWSSNFTWGGAAPPGEGEFVVVPQGQLLLLDESTPVLKMILIDGGELLFDEQDITLRAENILIVKGGRLTVGTEEQPFEHNAVIEMHGQLRAKELPIYGAKCLAVREGELNLHGKPIRMTWTRLAATAAAGDTEIELEWGQLDWAVGSTIVIATTGDRHSQKETETRVIADISDDGTVITLDEALEYEHLGVTAELGGGHTLEMRAEIGLLSRNVKVIGSRDMQWSDEIEACPDGFDTGEFTTQTCFQGRFGDEVGSDQFGAQIMFHAPFPDQQLVVGKLSYIEVTYAGQAFKLGRYPVHFHLNGDMEGSYVKGLAIHETFNRAINVHGTHNMLVEHTVIHNVMGGALFLEDGIETGNRYYYNLALFVKASTSLLNDDITPAAFWATNPNNHYEHNAAAGGTHFGWWYRMKEHPEGPSATTDYCPQHEVLGTVYNNTVHSQGWFGLWTFMDWFPMVGGTCGSSEPEPAIFRKFIVWNCDKGLEFVNAGALQFHDSILANNRLCGLEGKVNMKLGNVPYTDRGPMLNNSIIAAYVPNYEHEGASRRHAVVLPWSEGFQVLNTKFINYDSDANVVFGMTTIQGTCLDYCGGWNYVFDNLEFINGDQHKANFRWINDGVFVDTDGSFSGTVGGKILPWMDTLDPSHCQLDDRFSIGPYPGAVCDETTSFMRLSFNKPNMDGMLFKDVIFENEFGTHKTPFASKRMTHKDGWTTVLQRGMKYKWMWENLEHLVNMSYTAGFDDVGNGQGGVVLVHNMTAKPDRFQVIPGQINEMTDASPNQLNYDNNVHGDFFFDDNNKEISFLISDVTSQSNRRKRSTEGTYLAYKTVPNAYRCYWPNCDPPPDQNTLPPITSRPDHAVMWSNTSAWPNGQLPTDDSDVTIAGGMWVVADVAFPRINKLVLVGNLEMDHKKIPNTDNYRDFTLEVNFIIIQGGRLVVGWEDDRFMGNVEIILHGTQNDEPWPQTSGTSVGTKAIAVYGGLDIHGKQRSPVQSYLTATADIGDDQIAISHDSDWQVGEEIVIATTTFDGYQTESVTITAINGRTITFTPALQHKHIGEILTDEAGNEHRLSAEVMLVNRNVVVRGGEHSDMVRLGYGGRVLVSTMVDSEGTALIGWARVSYAQFINMGQLGYSQSFDARFAMTYDQTGPTSSVKPSYLKGNSFTMGFSPQIGFFGAEEVSVLDNCMYRVVGGGMVVTGDGFQVERNLVMHNLWPGSYEGRVEVKNVFYEGSFELRNAGPITFRENVAAGSERAGLRTHGEPCMGEEQTSVIEGNRFHSCMFGVMMQPGDELYTPCYQIAGHFLWKNFDYGIWLQQGGDRIEVNNNTLIENGMAVWTLTFGPASLSHDRTLNEAYQSGGYVSGPTEFWDCDVDVIPSTPNYGLSSLARSWRINRNGIVGIAMHSAESSPNNEPTHPFAGRMSYPLINGRHIITGVTFANWGARTCGGSTVNDFALTSNPGSDDHTHPIYISSATVESSADKENLVYFHRSNVGKVNPSDCVDMDCDGFKKLMVEDMDGSYIGQAGTIIDDAAWQWDKDARYGYGDYRIPKLMLTFPNNSRMDPPANKGIYRGDDCTWHDTWQGYECYGTVYRQVVIENMDADTEARRLSPIGIKERSGDWIDLLNGPQDHGWCAGYTCQLRISTFWAAMAMGKTYDVYLTGTNPQHTRFFMLQAADTESVRLAVHYHSPQRLDVFGDDTYIYPSNAVIEDDGNYKLEPSEQSPSEWLPSLDGGIGQNFFDRDWQLQYFILRGTGVVDIIIKEVVMVSLSLPPMTIDDFFGENIVSNLAAFLEIDASKIRIVNVVRETSSRKRDTETTTIQIEIGDPPTSGADVSEVNSGDLNRDSLVNLTRQVVDAVQLGTLGTTLNLTILGIDVQEPLPAPENSSDSAWANLANGTTDILAAIQIPTRMEYHLPLVAEKEQQPFPTQPEFSMYDAAGELVLILGSRADPWKIRAVLRAGGSDSNAELIGETVCGFTDGICAFENLGISHSGDGYVIDFEIFDPAEASYTSVSESIEVSGAELTSGFSYVPSKDMLINHGDLFNVSVDIRDLTSGMPLEDIAWKDHAWEATLSIYTPEMSPANANLTGSLTKTFDVSEGVAVFDDLQFDLRGRYSLYVEVTSTPADYSLSGYSSVIEISSPAITKQAEDISYQVTIKLLEDFATVAQGKEELIELLVYNYLLNIDETAKYSDFVISEGSIVVDFVVTGRAAEVADILIQIEDDVESGLALTFPGGATKTFATYLAIDNVEMFDEPLTTTPEEVLPGPGDLSDAIIIAAAVSSVFIVIILAIIIFLIVKKKKTVSKTSHGDQGSQAFSPAVRTSHTPDPEFGGAMPARATAMPTADA